MPHSPELLAEVKSQQNVLITRAGLAVPSHDMHGKDIDAAMFTQFTHHVANSRHNLDAPQDTFLRSSRHLDPTCSDKDYHTGSTLWRKYAAIRKYVNNNITPIFVKFLGPDGKPPSGHTRENILLKTRRKLYEVEQQEAKLRSKNPAAYKIKPFSPSWFPVEWEVFVKFGRGSDKPERTFFIE
jgi:hypothetical protein